MPNREAYIAEVFNNVLGHDLRNPLSVVVMGAQMLKTAATADAPERTLKIAGRIENGGARLGMLLNELLEFSKLTLGQLPALLPSEFDLLELAKKVAHDLKQPAIAHPCEVKGTGNLTGTWDRERMTKVLASLLNQVTNSAPAGCTTQVDVSAIDDDSVSVEISNQMVHTVQAPDSNAGVTWLQILSLHKGLDISVYVANETIRVFGGTLCFHCHPASGFRFRALLKRNTNLTLISP